MISVLVAALAIRLNPAQALGIGSTKKSPKGDVELMYIPAGEFTMGSDHNLNEQPIRKVYLDAYWMAKNLITVGQFKAFCKAKTYPYDWKKQKPQWGWIDTHPMVLVNWDDARAYCRWAGGDLPTEAQFEKAARGTDAREYPWGNRFQATLLCTNTQSTAPVGSFPKGASPFGCFDMAGNVFEWCLDYYSANYNGLPDRNPKGPPTGRGRVLRGGDWGDDNPRSFRTAFRYADMSSTAPSSGPSDYKPGSIRSPLYGFRLAVPGYL
jgi:formylglycine-generating enzyme required for sulfatase activity